MVLHQHGPFLPRDRSRAVLIGGGVQRGEGRLTEVNAHSEQRRLELRFADHTGPVSVNGVKEIYQGISLAPLGGGGVVDVIVEALEGV